MLPVMVYLGVTACGGSFDALDSESLLNFSISSDERYFALSYVKGSTAAIYIASMDGKEVRQLSKPRANEIHVAPRFSWDRSEILFVAYPTRNDPRSCIYVINMDGSGLSQRTSCKSHITEAVFSPNGDKIYFLQSNSYRSYSPIARPHPHDFDVYSVANEEGERESSRITSQSAYSMGHLSVSPRNKNIFIGLSALDPENLNEMIGMYPSKESMPQGFEGVLDSAISQDGKWAVFTFATENPTPSWVNYGGIMYEKDRYTWNIYRMNLKTRAAKLSIQLKRTILSPQLFGDSEKVMFTLKPSSIAKQGQRFMQMNVDGSELTEVALEIP